MCDSSPEDDGDKRHLVIQTDIDNNEHADRDMHCGWLINKASPFLNFIFIK
jgi:hypothetical protein